MVYSYLECEITKKCGVADGLKNERDIRKVENIGSGEEKVYDYFAYKTADQKKAWAN